MVFIAQIVTAVTPEALAQTAENYLLSADLLFSLLPDFLNIVSEWKFLLLIRTLFYCLKSWKDYVVWHFRNQAKKPGLSKKAFEDKIKLVKQVWTTGYLE